MKINILKLLCFIFAIGFSVNSFSQTIDWTAPMPVDPNIRKGTLPNGLTYYIRANALPEKRVSMRLVVNAGSLMEDDDQLGLAHFTEHMAFNGTKNFEKNKLVDFLESMGIQFGPELNAYTSFDETVYMLQVPTDKPGLIDTAFMVLEDWAHQITFDDKEIDKERGVIVEEWRLDLGAQERMMKQYIPVILKGSRYADRLPIGKMEIINTFPYETIRRFYRDWYRPDLMAIVVVGDFDPDQIEQTIKTRFSSIPNPTQKRERFSSDVPNNSQPIVSIVADVEATHQVVQIFYKHDKRKTVTTGEYRRLLLPSLYNGMINMRLSELLQKPDAPFVYASSGYSSFIGRTKDGYSSTCVAKEGKILSSIEQIIQENERVRQFGFTTTELERQKLAILTSYESSAKELGKTQSNNYTEEYTRNFLENEPIPGIVNEYEYAKALLPTITIEEVNQLAKQWITDANMVALITVPLKEGIVIPTEMQVLQAIENGKNQPLDNYTDKSSDKPLLANKPKAGSIKKRKDNKEFGYTELRFKNGAYVILMPTNFQNNEILFSAYSPGGHSLYADKDFISASFASNIINMSGLGEFNQIELSKKLTGNTANISPWISDIREGMRGSCSPKDLETLLQLNYLFFTAPRQDNEVFESFVQRMKSQVGNMLAEPTNVYRDTLVKIINMNHPRILTIPTEAQLDKINLDAATRIYKDRFADASDFKFFFIGNFTVEQMIPFLETYIGGLPSTKRKETWREINPGFPAGVTDVTIHKGTEPKSMVTVMMSGDFDYTSRNRLLIDLSASILGIKLRESMREDQGGVYGVRASQSNSKFPTQEYSITVSFGCSPENVDTLVNTIFVEMKKLIAEGPTAADLDKVKEMSIRSRETNLKRNDFWLTALESKYFYGYELRTLEQYTEFVNSATPDEIKAAAHKYFTLDHFVKVVLMPENPSNK